MPEYFKEENRQGRRILAQAEKRAQEREDGYIAKVCSEYEHPLFEVPIDVYAFE